jgi:hypothetical protein
MNSRTSRARRTTNGPGSVPRLPRNLHPLLGGTALLSALAAVLLLAAPFAAAHGTVTFTAPYSGFTQTSSNYTAASGCAAFHEPTIPAWTPSTGTFQVSSATNSAKCATSSYAETYSSIDLTSPAFTTPAAGTGWVYADLSAAFSAKASLHLRTATNGSYIFGESEVYLVAALYVYDVTHHNTSLFGYATTTLVNQAFSTTGSFSLTMGWTNSTMYAFGTFTAHHLYQVQIDISALVYASTYGGGSTAMASLNLAGANGLMVSSIVAT